MTVRKINNFLNIFLLLLLAFLVYYFRDNLFLAWKKLTQLVQPCQAPITYSIDNFDNKFGLTREEFLLEIQKAEKIWEQASGRDLFRYADAGDLAINLVYDTRQKATDDLKKIGLLIKNDQNTFEALKKHYDSLLASYDERKLKLDLFVAAYEAARSDYEQDVERSNHQGGANKSAVAVFEQRRSELNDQVVAINKEKESNNSVTK